MIKGTFEGFEITGVATAVPTHRVKSSEYASIFGDEVVRKIVTSTGVNESYHSIAEQTASDLAFEAAKHLFDEMKVERDSIGVVVFASSHPDYAGPATAFVLHKRLELSENCIPFDVNLNCSAFVYGLYIICSMLNSGSAKRGLLLIGDTTTKVVSPHDTSRLLFGDAGAAILVEKKETTVSEINIGLKSDGTRYRAIITPGEGFRNPNPSHDMELWEDGICRSDYNLFMNGMDVFSFTMTDVPKLFEEFMNEFHVTGDDVDALILHQANAFIIKHLVKKIGIPMNKVPISLDRYGNVSGVSIPLTLCDFYGNTSGKRFDLMLSGFGVGLSWGVVTLNLNADVVLPIIHTDECYTEGIVRH